MKYVILSPDGTAVITSFHGPQSGITDYAEIADDDARYLKFQAAIAGAAAYNAAIAAGCAIVSTGTAAISGTYGIVAQDEINMSGLQAGIAAGAPWLGWYRDIDGARHTMTSAQATALFTAILGYVEALEEAYETTNGGDAWVAPAQPNTIA